MTTDMVEILREQGRHDIADEIERLRAEINEARARIAELEVVEASRLEALKEGERMRGEIWKAITRGTVAEPDPAPVGFGVTYDIPPSTPR